MAVRSAPRTEAAAARALARARDHLLSLQHAQGWWKGELQTNVTMDAEDLLLREFLGIRAPDATARSAAWIERARVFTHIWLALFGLWPWDGIPALPPELMFLPSRAPLNTYDFGCWARQTVVALTIVLAH